LPLELLETIELELELELGAEEDDWATFNSPQATFFISLQSPEFPDTFTLYVPAAG